MKRIKQIANLSNEVETITAMDFRKSPGEVFLQVQLGKSFKITRNGIVIAVVSPPELNAFELGAEVRRLKLAK
jgi:hypothetical protein